MSKYKDVIVTKILGEIEEKYGESNFNVSTLSNSLNMNRTTLFRTTKKFLDKTPYELLDKYRLQRATDLLKENKTPLKDVAFMTGHTSYGYFATKFKKQYNQTPKEFKMSQLS